MQYLTRLFIACRPNNRLKKFRLRVAVSYQGSQAAIDPGDPHPGSRIFPRTAHPLVSLTLLPRI